MCRSIIQKDQNLRREIFFYGKGVDSLPILFVSRTLSLEQRKSRQPLKTRVMCSLCFSFPFTNRKRYVKLIIRKRWLHSKSHLFRFHAFEFSPGISPRGNASGYGEKRADRKRDNIIKRVQFIQELLLIIRRLPVVFHNGK